MLSGSCFLLSCSAICSNIFLPQKDCSNVWNHYYKQENIRVFVWNTIQIHQMYNGIPPSHMEFNGASVHICIYETYMILMEPPTTIMAYIYETHENSVMFCCFLSDCLLSKTIIIIVTTPCCTSSYMCVCAWKHVSHMLEGCSSDIYIFENIVLFL